MRLNAWLARAGVASRRGADELIKAGRVTVNGEPGQLNTFVAAHDRVELDGRELAKQQLAYVLLHKPAGAVTTARDPQGRRTVLDLVDHPARVVPVGRLDADTTGALLLTNDGELAHRLAHPSREVDKVYVAEVEGDAAPETLAALERGVVLDDGPTAPARAPARPRPRRADDPRGPQASGQAHARRGRPPGAPAAPQRLRGPDPGGARARRLARARPGGGRPATARRAAGLTGPRRGGAGGPSPVRLEPPVRAPSGAGRPPG
jgi:16S rRNA U516 pseudouridylate synthase RsuA-like enzyme